MSNFEDGGEYYGRRRGDIPSDNTGIEVIAVTFGVVDVEGGPLAGKHALVQKVGEVMVSDVLAQKIDTSPMFECVNCESDLVYPIAWEERKGDLWYVETRCPDCECYVSREATQDEVEEFGDTLNEGTEELLIELRNLSRQNMESDVELLISAIRNDHIEPMDF